jgi:hypothetical protein
MHFYSLFCSGDHNICVQYIHWEYVVKHGQYQLDIRFWMNLALDFKWTNCWVYIFLFSFFIFLFFYFFIFLFSFFLPPLREHWNSILTPKNIALNGWFSFCFYTFLKQWFLDCAQYMGAMKPNVKERNFMNIAFEKREMTV